MNLQFLPEKNSSVRFDVSFFAFQTGNVSAIPLEYRACAKFDMRSDVNLFFPESVIIP